MWPGAWWTARDIPGEFSVSQDIRLSVAAFDKNVPCLLIRSSAALSDAGRLRGWRIIANTDRMQCAPKIFGASSRGDFRYEHIWQETEEGVGGHSGPDEYFRGLFGSERSATFAGTDKRGSVVVSLGLHGALLVRSKRRQSLVGLPAKKHRQSFPWLQDSGGRNRRRAGRGSDPRSAGGRADGKRTNGFRALSACGCAFGACLSRDESAAGTPYSSLVLRTGLPSLVRRCAARRRPRRRLSPRKRSLAFPPVPPRSHGRHAIGTSGSRRRKREAPSPRRGEGHVPPAIAPST
jgi:hypothetical protein